MKVKLTLDVAPYTVFPVMSELEYEVALGTYLEQSQVKIMGATADVQNQGRTIVDINLVPLGEKFDNTTAALTYERLWHKKVPLNKSLFGDYAVVYITYPGIPSSPPYGTSIGSGPSENADGSLPVSANFASKNQKTNLRTIIIIALSSFVLLLVLVGAFSVTLKWRKSRRPSSAVGPVFTSSLNKRSGLGSVLSSSITSSTSVSLMSAMPTSILSVKTFSLSEIEKATHKFNSKRVLREEDLSLATAAIAGLELSAVSDEDDDVDRDDYPVLSGIATSTCSKSDLSPSINRHPPVHPSSLPDATFLR